MNKATKNKRKKLVKKLKNQYRLTIFNNSTYEERFTYQLTPINVIVAFGASFLLLGFAFISIVVFTPLRELIPGYTATEIKRSAYENAVLIDSLERELQSKSVYVNNLMAILRDEPLSSESETNNLNESSDYENIDLSLSETDSLFRARFEENQKLSSASAIGNMPALHFFKPVKGYVTERFDWTRKHYGIDIAASKDEMVMATKSGRVIQAAYTSEHGYVLSILHQDGFISFYKHNSVLLKEIGDKVEAGESIAVVGNTGKESSGSHLHFEIWKDGQPEDPEKYIVFD